MKTSEEIETCQPQPSHSSTPTFKAEKRNANHQKREKQSGSMKLLLKLLWKKRNAMKEGKSFK